MAYCTQADILEQVSEAELIALTDDEGAGAVDSGAVTRAIADADAEIDAALSVQYTTPLSTVPTIIRRLSVDCAIYHLHSRRSVAGVPEVRSERYRAADKMLQRISNGSLSIGVTASATTGTVEYSNPDTERVFTDDTLADW